MRRFVQLTLCCGLLCAPVPAARADGEAEAIIDRAIKAYGGPEKLKITSAQMKSKGTLEILGGIGFTQEVTFLLPDKFKEVMDLEVNGQKITAITVYNGTQAWVSTNGQTMELKDKLLDEIKQAASMMQISRILPLKDHKTHTLSLLGETMVNDKPAEGVKVSTKGLRDVNVYFDKKSGLIAKIERQALDPMTQQEVSEERIVLEYQDIDGYKVAKKVQVSRNGRKFTEAEVLEFKPSAKVEASDFEKP